MSASPVTVTVVIPARYAATRLPGKPLADIHGKPMVQWVYEKARKAKGVDRVVVATDDGRVFHAVQAFGGEAVMTPSDLQSGTDRVAAVADQSPKGSQNAQSDYDIYVNVQGDEPLMDPRAIELSIKLIQDQGFPMSTVMTPLRTQDELMDPSVVKVIADRQDKAIYFSRLPIPYSRGLKPEPGQPYACCRHVGIYAYRREILMKFREFASSSLEKGEVLEQLRALENGIAIGIKSLDFTSIGVDTPEDLEKVRRYLV